MTVKDYPENQPENSDSISSDKEGSKTQLKSNNPFLQSDSSPLSPSSSSENVKPAFNYTLIPSEKLIEYPFKSLNRIIDDLKYTTVYKKKWPNLLSFSLLNSIPITYSSDLSQLLSSSNTYRDFELLTLNNHLDYAPSFEEIELKESDQILKNIRGLLDEMLIDLGDDELKTEGPVEDENHPEAGKEEIVEDKETEPQILKISTDQMESTIEVGRQQDVTECIENVTFQIETALEPLFIEEDGEQFDLIKKLFYGKTKQTIKPMENENGSNKLRESAERFFSLIINVSDHPKDIYDSLDNYFNEDVVSLEEGLVKKTLTIKELPEVLQFHVQRVLFDREKLIAYKSLEPIPFSEQIYLDRYLDTEDEEILNKKQEVFKWKSEISSLYEKRDDILKLDPETNLSIIDSLIATKKFLEAKIINHESLSIKAETILAIQDQIDSLKDELQSIHDRLTILQEQTSNQFKAYTKIGYSIFAIFIHRGEASYGHYWVYIKDPHRNIYRKYNDEIVTEVPASEVLNFTEGNTATPYYIVYVKDSLKKDYVEPLKRVINKC